MAGGVAGGVAAAGVPPAAPPSSVDRHRATAGNARWSIPSIRDRVAQMAVLLVIGPIFEADLCDEQYGFRPGVDAKMAVRQVYFNVTEPSGVCAR